MKLLNSKIVDFLGKIEWPNFLFIVLTPIVAIGGTVWVFQNGGPHWATWILAASLLMATGLGITAGYHRLFSHRTYQASWIIKALLLFFGGASFEGSVTEWCCQHRKHHRYVDTDKDPYNIKKGFWYAHVGWVVFKSDQSDESNIVDLKNDPLIAFQNKYYIPSAILGSLGLPVTLAVLWGDIWGGLFVAGFLRMVVNHHLTFLINSYAHYFGRQTYSNKNTARDSWLIAFFTYGEGFHNFHHAFEADYRNGIRAYHYDPGKWLIRFLSWAGLTFKLRKARDHKILQARLEMDEKRLVAELSKQPALYKELIQFLEKTRTQIEKIHANLAELKVKYRQLKKEKTESVMGKIESVRQEIEQMKNELKIAMSHWQSLIQGKWGTLPVGA